MRLRATPDDSRDRACAWAFLSRRWSRAQAFEVAWAGYAIGVSTDESHPLTELTVRELLAELTRVEDRLREQAHHAGPRPLPGQVSREAALRRRERLLLTELAARRASLADQQLQTAAAPTQERASSAGAPRHDVVPEHEERLT